jgi:hypothetical protein
MIVFAMLRPVEFDNDFRPVACEIGNVIADRHLPTKM